MRKIRFTLLVEGNPKGALVTVSWFLKGTDISYNQSGMHIEELPSGQYDYILHGRLLLGNTVTVAVDDITDLSAVIPLIPEQLYDTVVFHDTCGYQVP
jgi:hypothetical protein